MQNQSNDDYVNSFWAKFEYVPNNIQDLIDNIHNITSKLNKRPLSVAWRGQANASWGLHSVLYRKLQEKNNNTLNKENITEKYLSTYEKLILTEVRDWGLHINKQNGRLSILNQLAMLQHFKSPTRLIDISFNAYVALFFAVDDKPDTMNKDSRIFAFNLSNRLINQNKQLRSWEDMIDTPWSRSSIRNQYYELKNRGGKLPLDKSDKEIDTLQKFESGWSREWASQSYAWKPAPPDARNAAQNGGFLFGGAFTPAQTRGFIHSHDDKDNAIESPFEGMQFDEISKITSIAANPHILNNQNLTFATKTSLFTIRIPAEMKQEIRDRLQNVMGYKHSTIYPDLSGFEEHAVQRLINTSYKTLLKRK